MRLETIDTEGARWRIEYRVGWHRPEWLPNSMAYRRFGDARRANEWARKVSASGAQVTRDRRRVLAYKWEPDSSFDLYPKPVIKEEHILDYETILMALNLVPGDLFPSPRDLHQRFRLYGLTRKQAEEIRNIGLTNGSLKWVARRQVQYVGDPMTEYEIDLNVGSIQ